MFEYSYLKGVAVDSCSVCGSLENWQSVAGCPDVPDVNQSFFYSDDLVPIASREIDWLWGDDARLIPIGETTFRQVVPNPVIEVAIADTCREVRLCSGGDHFAARLGCDDVYVPPPEQPLVARSALPTGSYNELRYRFFVRSDVNRYLWEHVLGYESRRIKFVDDDQ